MSLQVVYRRERRRNKTNKLSDKNNGIEEGRKTRIFPR